jgi:hypothetical protein
MHKILLYAAFAWLTATGALHFGIDVAAQYLRGKRLPGAETTLYYGLNTAFALGQVIFGLLCLWLAWRAPALLATRPVMALCLLATAGWLAISFLFMGYREPRMNTVVFAVLLIAACATA